MPSTIKKRGNLWYYDSNTQRNRQRISLKTSNHRVALRAKRILDERRAKNLMWESTAFAQPLEGVVGIGCDDHPGSLFGLIDV